MNHTSERQHKRKKNFAHDKHKKRVHVGNCDNDSRSSRNLDLVECKLHIFGTLNYFPLEIDQLILKYDTPHIFQEQWEKFQKQNERVLQCT